MKGAIRGMEYRGKDLENPLNYVRYSSLAATAAAAAAAAAAAWALHMTRNSSVCDMGTPFLRHQSLICPSSPSSVFRLVPIIY